MRGTNVLLQQPNLVSRTMMELTVREIRMDFLFDIKGRNEQRYPQKFFKFVLLQNISKILENFDNTIYTIYLQYF